MKSGKRIYSERQWEELKGEAFGNKELLVFKYSPRCGISIFIERDFDSWYNRLPAELDLMMVKVNVVAERQLSRLIANDLEVIHQSPQLIWLNKKGEIRFSGSHHGIEEKELNKVLVSMERAEELNKEKDNI